MEVPDMFEVEDHESSEKPENPAEFDLGFRELTKASQVQIDIMFECEWGQCGKEFKTSAEHCAHIEVHAEEINNDEQVCKWDLCDFDTADKQTLVRHLYVHAYHSRIKTLGASFCASVNLPTCKMDSKQRNVVTETKGDFFCYWNDCKQWFVNPEEFYQHARYHVAEDFFNRTPRSAVACTWYQCKRKAYTKQAQMEAHLATHTNQKLVACHNCGFRFVNKYRLVDHLKRQMEGTAAHQCPHCNKCFPFEKQLRAHMKSHINCFKCTFQGCDMTCSSEGALVKHIRYRHVKARPFQCMLCDFKVRFLSFQ